MKQQPQSTTNTMSKTIGSIGADIVGKTVFIAALGIYVVATTVGAGVDYVIEYCSTPRPKPRPKPKKRACKAKPKKKLTVKQMFKGRNYYVNPNKKKPLKKKLK